MKDLVQWSMQTPANEIVPNVRAALKRGMGWDSLLAFEQAAKAKQQTAAIYKMQDHRKSIKESEMWIGRSIGETLNAMEMAKAGRPKKNGFSVKPFTTYKDLGITKVQAFRYHKLAEPDTQTFRKIVEKTPSVAAVIKATTPEVKERKILSDRKKMSPMDPLLLSSMMNIFNMVKKGQTTLSTVTLYLYYCMHGPDCSPTQTEIMTLTRMKPETIKKHIDIIDELGGIHQIPAKKGRRTQTQVFQVLPPTPSSITRIKNIINLEPRNNYKFTSNTRKNSKGFTVDAVIADEDYKKAKAILLKYFDDSDIDPAVLLGKNRLSVLTELVQDDTFDFDAFSKWYQKNIYPEKGFGLGLLLYSSIIKQYKNTSARTGNYLKVSDNIRASKSHQEGIKKTDEFLERISKQMEKEEQNEKKAKAKRRPVKKEVKNADA
jgi:hypothetical protein